MALGYDGMSVVLGSLRHFRYYVAVAHDMKYEHACGWDYIF